MSNSLQTNKSKSLIYPELGETTKAEIEYRASYSNGFYLTTDLELKGRGITIIGNGSEHKRGKNTYRATETAMNKLKKNHEVCYIASF
jgi:hypothetical protein